MKIHKLINNNIVIYLNSDGNEEIIMGKGIGFKHKIGDEIDESMIEKRFTMSSNNFDEKYINNLPIEYLNLVCDLFEYAKVVLNRKLNQNMILALADHIYSAVKRRRDGIDMTNPILWEIKRYYEVEYQIAMHAIDMVNNRFGVRLLEDEAGFIAVHIIDAEIDNCDLECVSQITTFIHDVTNIVRLFFKIDFDTKNVNYFRFVTHIKFFAERVILKNAAIETGDDSLFEIIKDKYHNAYECVKIIAKHIKDKYNYDISKDEMLYLMIHIERVVYKK